MLFLYFCICRTHMYTCTMWLLRHSLLITHTIHVTYINKLFFDYVRRAKNHLLHTKLSKMHRKHVGRCMYSRTSLCQCRLLREIRHVYVYTSVFRQSILMLVIHTCIHVYVYTCAIFRYIRRAKNQLRHTELLNVFTHNQTSSSPKVALG